jgi:hypothetical protein
MEDARAARVIWHLLPVDESGSDVHQDDAIVSHAATRLPRSLPDPRRSRVNGDVAAGTARGDDGDDHEGRQDEKLSDDERRLGLLWGERVQYRDPAKSLDDADEDVQIERGDDGDDVDRPPPTAEVCAVPAEDRGGEHDERHDADDV